MKKLGQFKTIKVLIIAILLGAFTISFTVNPKSDPEKDRVLISLLKLALTKGHYLPKDLNDSFSELVYKNYLKNLDPRKRFFTQTDINYLAKYKDLIDDQIKSEDLSFFNEVYAIYNKRLKEASLLYPDLLDNKFDFKIKEEIALKYEDLKFSKNQAERIKKWQRGLKLNTISRIKDKMDLEKANHKKDSKYKIKSFGQVEKEARESTRKNMKEFFTRMLELNQDDAYAVFLNTITLGFDPHTTYFAPQDKKRFDISMAGKLEGIGARLQKKGDFTKIVELISGGPAWKKGELEVGDLIIKVAQGDKEPIDIVGMRLDDAIEFIKGKKGTEVRLTVKKIEGSIKVISIIRDIVELEEVFAKSSVVEKSGKKLGIINLPKFYIDFKKASSRNAATDMEKQIAYLKKENVKGILVDLRNNGGGSLRTAVDIAGLFIEKGPMVQVRYRGEKAKVLEDNNSKIQWDGPLVILVNEFSASASEIFAAAMQDYNRAVIIGSKQTFGKGTVQNILSLNNYVNYPKDLGALKMTIQKFYRVNGGATQLKGVTSDVALPDRYAFMKIGERDEENPLAWDKIEPASYTPWNEYTNFDEVLNESKIRVHNSDYFKLVNKNAKWLKQQQKNTYVQLNYKAFEYELEKRIKESKNFEDLNKFNDNLVFKSPLYEMPLLKKDSILEQKRTRWHKNLAKDAYVDEALNILAALRLKPKEHLVKN